MPRDAPEPQGPEKAQLDPVPPPLPEPSDVGNPTGPGLAQNSAQPPASLAITDAGQQLPARPPPASSVAVVASTPSQAAMRPDQQWPQSPPPDYYYYRPLYDGYQPQYPSPYPPDPGSGPLYYQVGGAGPVSVGRTTHYCPLLGLPISPPHPGPFRGAAAENLLLGRGWVGEMDWGAPPQPETLEEKTSWLGLGALPLAGLPSEHVARTVSFGLAGCHGELARAAQGHCGT